jgi:YD repeat-containing protein
MKIKLLIIIGLVSFLGYSQDDYQLPNFTPPSPEAAAMTKYADLEANEFRGMVSHTIPLYSYIAGNLELPLSVSYIGSGVRVDDVPTWVGMNWTLSAGGVITRVVKDLPDEAASDRIFSSNQDLTDYNSVVDGTSEANYLWNIAESSQQKDSEVDIFQFNFNGYSGSFYFDENWDAKLLKNDMNLKIIIDDNFYTNKTIIIITPDGIKYRFGGTDATEETFTRTVVNGSVQPDSYGGTTAFYLTHIEHPLNGDILLEYESINQEILIQNRINNLNKAEQYSDSHDYICTKTVYYYCDTDVTECVNREDVEIKNTIITISSRVLNQKYLKKIYSYNNSDTIHFNSFRVENSSFKRVLKDILITKENIPFKTVDFKYIGFSENPNPFSSILYAQKRFFLEEIIFDANNPASINTQSGRRNNVFKFEYNNPSGLPLRFAYSQDFGGYYNGILNTTNIPYHPFFHLNNNADFANRSPVFEKAKYGTLEKIFYPTGGYTEFNYEASSKAKKKNYKTISLTAYRNQSQFVNIDKLHDGVPQVLEDESLYGISNVYENQPVIINVKLRATIQQGDVILAQNEKATLKLTNIQTGEIVTHLLTMNSSNNGLNNSGIVEKEFNIPYGFSQGRDYKIEIDVFHPNPPSGNNSNPIPLEAIVFLKYYDGYTVVDDFGVRLKKITDYTLEGSPENIKRFYYNDIEDVTNVVDLELLPVLGESGRYIKTEYTISNKICGTNPLCDCSIEPGVTELWYLRFNLYSDRYDYNNGVQSTNYEKVTISYGGDNFEKGGKEKTFYKTDNFGGSKINVSNGGNVSAFAENIYQSLNIGNDGYINIPNVLNGTLKEEKYFKSENNGLKKISQITYIHEFSPIEKVNNIFAKKEFDAFFFQTNEFIHNTVSNYTILSYFTVSAKSEIISQISTQYIDPVPLGVTDESAYKKVITTQNYEYGALRGLPTKITTTTSQSGVINEVRNFYVNQATNPNYHTGLPVDQIQAVIDLNAQNIVSNPILVQQFKNNEKLGTKKTLYKNIGTNPSFPKIVPDIIQSGKGEETDNPLENRVRFLEYDGFGRPTLVSLENGTKTKYYYNGRNQVVMKIENFIAGSGSGGTITADDVVLQSSTDPCVYNTQFSTGIVTVYVYDSATNLLTKIIDTNCIETTYEYDALHRLKFIKDNDGNIIQEFDTSFKRY